MKLEEMSTRKGKKRVRRKKEEDRNTEESSYFATKSVTSVKNNLICLLKYSWNIFPASITLKKKHSKN